VAQIGYFAVWLAGRFWRHDPHYFFHHYRYITLDRLTARFDRHISDRSCASMAAAGIQADKADRLPASALLRPEKQLTSQGFEGDFTDTPVRNLTSMNWVNDMRLSDLGSVRWANVAAQDFQRASVLRDGETGAQGEDTPLTDATTVSQESSAVGSLRSLSHDYPSSAPALYSQGASGRQSTLGRTPFLSVGAAS
jgi:hypothetical protein